MAATYEELRQLVPHIWLSFQQMAEFEKDPLIIVGGTGVWARTADGRTLLDGVASAAVSALGYGNQQVQQAMKEQIDQMLFCPTLQATNEPALRLAARLASLLPGDLNRAFLTSGGSEATECAMKLARQYHIQTGNPGKYKIIGRYRSYHGTTVGALGASGTPLGWFFDSWSNGFLHALPPTCHHCPFGQPGPDHCHLECVEQIDAMIRYEGPGTVAAVIVDPVMAGAGVLVPRPDYYSRLREICDEHEVLLIFDEVLTGFGRLGQWFACDYYRVLPDIVCLGKGISSGFAPLAATVVRDHVARAFDGTWASGRQFRHGHTFGGNPLACATGLAVIDVIEQSDLVGHARELGTQIQQALDQLAEEFDAIAEVRGAGLLWGVQLAPSQSAGRPADDGAALAAGVVRACLAHENLIVRQTVGAVHISPPLIVSSAEVDEIFERLRRALRRTLPA